MSDLGYLTTARREVSRCRAALAGGSPRAFWIRRLSRASAELREAARCLDAQLLEMGIVDTAQAPVEPIVGRRARPVVWAVIE